MNVLHINQFEMEFTTEQWTHKFNTLSMISLIRVLEHDTETGNTVMMFETCSYININSNTFLCFLSQITPSAIFQVIRKCIQNSNLDIRKLLVRVIFYEKIKS